MKKPIIGITLDSEKHGAYSKFPWYALRENYLTSISTFNAIPVPLFHEKKLLCVFGFTFFYNWFNRILHTYFARDNIYDYCCIFFYALLR